MPPLYQPDPFPEWKSDPETGEVSYQYTTEDGLEIQGRARPKSEEVDLEFSVRNGTGSAISRIASQMCLSLTGSKEFNRKTDLSSTFAWMSGICTNLSGTTPSPQEKGRDPWILILTRKGSTQYSGSRDYGDGWWVVDQVADNDLIARENENEDHLVAIAWDDEPLYLMTNTRIPCLHAGPTSGTSAALKPGQKATWRGKVYLVRNDPDLLLERYLAWRSNRTGPEIEPNE
jgi:hypothetical protein